MLMTTTETVPGYVIERVLGLVEASSAHAGPRAVRERVAREAGRMGANAVLGMPFSGGSGGMFSGTVCYGTAVVIRSETTDGGQPG